MAPYWSDNSLYARNV